MITSSLKQTPLLNFHVTHGAKMVPFAGYEMPIQYPTGIMAEHHHVRNSVGLFDVSHMGAILVEGETATQDLEYLLPTDLAEMPIGQTKYSFFLNEKGGILDDLLASKIETGYLLVVNAGGKETDLAHLQKHAAPTTRITPLFDHGILALQGPKAKEIMADLFPQACSLCFMSGGYFGIEAGTNIWISRTGYTGEDGFEMVVPPSTLLWLTEKILAFPDVQLIGLGARDSLRLEAGLCLYGHDLTEETTPVEAGLVWALGKRRRQEGGFLGGEKILGQLKEGVSKKRVGLALVDKAVAREGMDIKNNQGESIGFVTSGGHSPSKALPIAMGYVNVASVKDQQSVFIDIRGQQREAHFVKLPFVTHNYYRG